MVYKTHVVFFQTAPHIVTPKLVASGGAYLRVWAIQLQRNLAAMASP